MHPFKPPTDTIQVMIPLCTPPMSMCTLSIDINRTLHQCTSQTTSISLNCGSDPSVAQFTLRQWQIEPCDPKRSTGVPCTCPLSSSLSVPFSSNLGLHSKTCYKRGRIAAHVRINGGDYSRSGDTHGRMTSMCSLMSVHPRATSAADLPGSAICFLS